MWTIILKPYCYLLVPKITECWSRGVWSLLHLILPESTIFLSKISYFAINCVSDIVLQLDISLFSHRRQDGIFLVVFSLRVRSTWAKSWGTTGILVVMTRRWYFGHVQITCKHSSQPMLGWPTLFSPSADPLCRLDESMFLTSGHFILRNQITLSWGRCKTYTKYYYTHCPRCKIFCNRPKCAS